MKRYTIILILSIFILNSCGEDETGLNQETCPEELICTEELRYLSYKAKLNGEPIVLDNYYVKNLDNGNIYQSSPLESQLAEGQYIVVSDVYRQEVKKSGTILRFFGIKHGTIVLQQDFVVGHDCCHIQPLAGPFAEEY